ncbi:hypothetical protein NDU88_005250 [Pleurodeles waltl]|uniref:Uncharacterized protein n=1 Tax=Pleurodeles waltl TaxID=8319 RepID=A0AAV7N3T6_PLEWA|nr:hypothetical protein NDU88_005250 [Pleurodeles waltl]
MPSGADTDGLQALGGPGRAFPAAGYRLSLGGEIAVISCGAEYGPRDFEHGDAEDAAAAVRGLAGPRPGGALSATMWGRGGREEALRGGRNRSQWGRTSGAAAQAIPGQESGVGTAQELSNRGGRPAFRDQEPGAVLLVHPGHGAGERALLYLLFSLLDLERGRLRGPAADHRLGVGDVPGPVHQRLSAASSTFFSARAEA